MRLNRYSYDDIMIDNHHYDVNDEDNAMNDTDRNHHQYDVNDKFYRERHCEKDQNFKVKKCDSELANYSSRSDHSDARSYTEKRCCVVRQNKQLYSLHTLYSVFIFIFVYIARSYGQTISCDFTGSGLDLDGSGVQPVYLSCAAGRVNWQYPRAALRIILKYPHSDKEFRGCIKPSPNIDGARLFVEGHRSLVSLYAKDDGRPSDMIRCFTSHKGKAALYLEAEPSTGGFKKLMASFDYDLQPLTKGEIYDPLEECRPCSDAELVSLYCSADFAARGFIVSSEDDRRLGHTTVTLSASRVFQQTTPIFSQRKKAPKKKYKHSEDNYELTYTNNLMDEGQFTGRLFMPIQCEAKDGPGEFMVLGVVRLGQPILRCAPRIEYWRKLVISAQDQAHCVLEA